MQFPWAITSSSEFCVVQSIPEKELLWFTLFLCRAYSPAITIKSEEATPTEYETSKELGVYEYKSWVVDTVINAEVYVIFFMKPVQPSYL